MKIRLIIILCTFSTSALACIPTQKPSLMFVPEPIWIFDQPKENKAIVKAKIDIDPSGRISIKKIIEVTPKDIPLHPLKDAISKARFSPMKFKTPGSNTWVAGSTTIEHEFELTW